jgi:hypothetical protein
MEEMVTITKKEYERLLSVDLHMDLLKARGVDNWDGYGYPPDREDFDTDEEYQQALEDSFDSW